MMLSDPAFVFGLAALDIGLFALAGGGLAYGRWTAFRPSSSAQSFALLEWSLKRAFPDLPAGYTWREAMKRIESLSLEVDLTEVGKALRQYEGWRYGETVEPKDVNSEVVRLAKALAGRRRSWPRD